MSNLYKSAYVVQKESESRIIDSNEIVAQKIQQLTEMMESQFLQDDYADSYDGFVEGLDAMQVESLLGDPDAAEAEVNSINEQIAVAREELERIRGQADAIVADAKAQAQDIISSAEKNAVVLADEARRSGHEEGYNAGYSEGMQKAKLAEDQVYERDALRQREYENKVSEIEPMLVDKLCDIYEHVLGTDLAGRSDTVLFLLERALHSIEGGINFLVHVSADDFAYATGHKEDLTSLLGPVNTLELIEDITLTQGQSFIETESGIYDCSFGVEMELLKKELKLLSRD